MYRLLRHRTQYLWLIGTALTAHPIISAESGNAGTGECAIFPASRSAIDIECVGDEYFPAPLSDPIG